MRLSIGGRRITPSSFPLERRKLTPTQRAAARVIAIVSFLAVWFLAYVFVFSQVQEGRAQHRLYGTLREQLANAEAPLTQPITPGVGVAVLNAPTAGIHDLVVVEGTSSTNLQEGPGHYRASPLPGQTGTSVIFGRATAFGAPFAHLARLKAGDRITTTTAQGQFTYIVSDLRRQGDPFPTPLLGGQGRLTLATGEGSGWQSGWAPDHALYVDATLRGDGQVESGDRPSAVPDSEKILSGQADTITLLQMVLWLQLLLISCVGVVWALVKWARWQAWLAGSPLVLLALWGATATAIRLLPNVL